MRWSERRTLCGAAGTPAEIAWMASGFGNPSARYLYVTVPGLTVLAGMAVSEIARFLRSAAHRPASRTVPSRSGVAVVAGLLILVVGATAYVEEGERLCYTAA